MPSHPFLETFGSANQPSFSSPAGLAVDQSTGDVYVIDIDAQTLSRYDEEGNPVEFSGLGTNVIDGKNGADVTPQGKILGSFGAPNEVEVAIDESGGSTDGNIYVTDTTSSVIDIFSSTGSYLGQLSESSEGSFGESCGVAVDSAGAVYTGDYNGKIHKFVPSGSFPVNADNAANFTYSEACQLAAGAGSTAGSIFVTSYGGQLGKLDSSTGALEYTLESGVTTAAVDPASGHVYALVGSSLKEFDASGSSGASTLSVTSLSGSGNGVATRGATEEVYVSGASNVQVYGPLPPPVPKLEGEWASDVVSSEAKLNAAINPQSSATTYHFEWGPSAAYGNETPELAVGSDSSVHHVVRLLSGLTEGTTYHYRVVAVNSVGTTVGADRTFTTYAPTPQDTSCPNQAYRTGAGAELPDCRAYEMVSPVDKNGGDITWLFGGGFSSDAGYSQSSLNGEKVTYSSGTAFGDALSHPFTSQYIATRHAGVGWSTHAINPPERGGQVLAPGFIDREYKVFSPDLSYGWLAPESGLALAPGAAEGYVNLYRRDNLTDSYRTLTIGAREADPSSGYEIGFEGASADGTHAIFVAPDSLTPDAPPPGNETNLYEWVDGSLRLVSILPGGEPVTGASSSAGNVAGAGTAPLPGRAVNLQHAISDDGSRIFWTRQDGTGMVGQLYARIDGTRTIPVSESVSSGDAAFWTASADGSKVIFTTNLTDSAQGSGELYEFDVDDETPTLIAHSGLGVVGASEDASRIYFVSDEALAPGATAGEPNLYLRHGGAETFIATLAPGEVARPGHPESPAGLASADPSAHNSRVTPDGRQVLFMSKAPLTGYDNVDAGSGRAASEVFRYDAGSGRLSCVSCKPSGARPVDSRGIPKRKLESFFETEAAAWIPRWESSLYGTRPISDDGSRVFFNSFDALVPQDTNGAQDVYEWEAPGAGSCSESSPAYSAQDEGCLYLISSGQSPEDSEFTDASQSGADVFFRTSSSLVPQDPGQIDLYDARAGGGLPTPPAPAAACQGDTCQSPPEAPRQPSPASAVFHGAGTPAPALNCGAQARRALRLAHRATRLRHSARRVRSNRRSQALRRRSARLAKRAKGIGKRARRCRRAERRARR
ncbi:MAG TPA: hypothetical protein VFN89_03600 [Solirubrobacterales bacterium]|nr:hypothetical protein [Solirubrobacterales bacterium]